MARLPLRATPLPLLMSCCCCHARHAPVLAPCHADADADAIMLSAAMPAPPPLFAASAAGADAFRRHASYTRAAYFCKICRNRYAIRAPPRCADFAPTPLIMRARRVYSHIIAAILPGSPPLRFFLFAAILFYSFARIGTPFCSYAYCLRYLPMLFHATLPPARQRSAADGLPTLADAMLAAIGCRQLPLPPRRHYGRHRRRQRHR